MNDEHDSGLEEEPLEELENEAEDESGQEKRKNARLTDEEYAEARQAFEFGKARVVELADKYGVTRQALWKRFKADGVKWGSRMHEATAAAAAGVAKAAEAVAERYAEQRLAWIEETRITHFKDLKQARQIAKKIVAETLIAKRSLATADDDLKAAHRYVRILEQNTRVTLDLLDAGNDLSEDDLPKLIIDDLTADQIVDFHREQGIEDPEELDEILKNFEQDYEE